MWGKEGEDWDFYYKEDKEAYEKGESTLPDVLNARQISDNNYKYEDNQKDRFKLLQGVKSKLEKEDGAIYRVQRKPNKGGGGHDKK